MKLPVLLAAAVVVSVPVVVVVAVVAAAAVQLLRRLEQMELAAVPLPSTVKLAPPPVTVTALAVPPKRAVQLEYCEEQEAGTPVPVMVDPEAVVVAVPPEVVEIAPMVPVQDAPDKETGLV